MVSAELITIGTYFFASFLGSLMGCLAIYISTEHSTEHSTGYKDIGLGYKAGNKYTPLHRTESQEYEVELRNKPDRFK